MVPVSALSMKGVGHRHTRKQLVSNHRQLSQVSHDAFRAASKQLLAWGTSKVQSRASYSAITVAQASFNSALQLVLSPQDALNRSGRQFASFVQRISTNFSIKRSGVSPHPVRPIITVVRRTRCTGATD